MPEPEKPTVLRHRFHSWLGPLGLALALSLMPTAAAAPADRSPIYWRQNLLTVPYEWKSTGGAAAKTVRLYVSKDRGASWQPVSDAQPQLLAFNYRAEADGEYWFAIRTVDASGRDVSSAALDATGGLQPELRVVVDTTLPRIDSLSGQLRDDGTLDVRWQATDANLSAHSCSIEVQSDGATEWQPVPLTSASEVSLGVWEGQATLAVPPGVRPSAVRATAIDLAGNRALFQSPVAPNHAADLRAGAAPALPSSHAGPQFSPPSSEAGWVSSSAPSLASAPSSGSPEPQLWPADRSARDPLESSSGAAASLAHGTPVDASARPASPPVDSTADTVDIPQPRMEDSPLGNVPPARDPELAANSLFRSASLIYKRLPPVELLPAEEAVSSPSPAHSLARLVNSRTFALEYELDGIGNTGVAKVEVWGTRDDGKSWQRYAVDDDNRSPVELTVDGEGEYGFSIVVTAAGAVDLQTPQPGDEPELRIRVDLQPPMAQLLSVHTRRNDAQGELTIEWNAADDNLEPRPISLYYSSRPAGPWTAIATDLENSGEYSWPFERHVPRRIYLKLAARDTAGNVAAFQTSEPVVVENPPVVADWQRLPPIE